MPPQHVFGSTDLIPYDQQEQERVFGYTQEDMDKIILPMARDGKQPIDSMGMDIALPILSDRPQLLYDYFQENFAQVTNPPIDGVRENIVMSSIVMAGNVANMPGLFQSVTFLTTAIAKEMSYAGGLQRQALFSIALVLFVFIMVINALLNFFLKGGKKDDK